jgi:hypothetical protein
MTELKNNLQTFLSEHTGGSVPTVTRMARSARKVTLVSSALLLGALVGMVSPARAADPVPFATASGHCDPSADYGSVSLAFPTQTSAHPNAVLRVVASAPGDFMLWPGEDMLNPYREYFGGGDTTWVGDPIVNSLDAGATPELHLSCSDTPSDFQAQLYDVPTAPTSYTGVGTFIDGVIPVNDEAQGSELFFNVPTRAPYVADLTLQQGAVTLRYDDTDTSRSFASSGTFPLGSPQPGLQSLSVTPLDGPPAHWHITIRPLPVQVSAVAFDRAEIRPGNLTTASYQLSGDASVTATVLNAAGKEVRQLASAMSAQGGHRSLRWDGFDNQGVPVPDGQYRLRIAATDSTGATSSGETEITVDGHGPRITLLSPLRISSTRAVSLQVADPLSGIRSAWLSVDGQVVAKSANSPLVYRPQTGWSGGHHSLRLVATDRLGNTSSFTRTLTVPDGRGAIRTAATTTAGLSGLPRLLGDGPHYSLTWQIRPARISYTGDGTGVLGGGDGNGRTTWGHLTWTSWTRTRAVGNGVDWIKDCTPDCAHGTWHAHPVTLAADRGLAGRFRRLTVYTGKQAAHLIVARAPRPGYWWYVPAQ